ncbi:MAG TPA: transcription antitermination factor NusB [Pyrinomonadaceae bacterium]|jgi:N utilization substance protein B|nr:transcription antitermination factor NusB [Pyrinomonadaceae bacterium]
MGTRRKARECALQMLFAADVTGVLPDTLSDEFWSELDDGDADQATRDFADNLAKGTIEKVNEIDELIRSRAEHWRIPRMAVVDRNILRMAVYEFVYEPTPRTVVINEALEIARRFSTYEATQFINGILDAVKHDLDSDSPDAEKSDKKKKGTSA